MSATTVADLLTGLAEDPDTADRPALLFEDDRWTWAALHAEAVRRAAALTTLRGGPAGRFHVGLLMQNTPEYLFLIAAAALAGATVVGVNPTRRGDDLACDARGVDLDLLLVDDTYAELLDGLDLGLPRERVIATEAWQRRLPDTADPPRTPVEPSTPLLLTFTSGSTGAPKAVICSTGRLAAIAAVNTMGLTVDDVAYNAMPLFHGNALMAAWASCLASGAAFAMRRTFSASGFLPDVQHFGATFFNYVGRSLAYILAVPEQPGERDHRLRFGFGTEASSHDRAEFLRRFGVPVFESYGQSEGGCYIVLGPGTPDGALGLPREGHDVVILDEEGRECPRARLDATGRLLNPEEAIGEVVNRQGAALFEGYYKNPAAAAERVRGAAYHTGDLGYRDTDGWFWFAGRTADWMRVDSENLATAPLERLLTRFPSVHLVAVYGVPDPVTGDAVMATLELQEGGRFDPAAFAAFLASQPDLGTKGTPSFVRIVAAMPVTATRKLDKPALRRLAWWGTEDPVWIRDGGTYRLLDEVGRAELCERYRTHGREDLLSRRR